MRLKTLCVFCASASGARVEYQQDAEALGIELARRGIGLVYGGASVGLMGVVANATLQNGGRCIGVIPHVLVDKEVSHIGLTELHVVDTMHTRKALMGEKSDAFLILPGGYGTMEELFEVLTWQTLRLHAKPTVLLNTAGFYDRLLQFLDHCVEEGVLKPAARANLMVATTVDDALSQIEAALATG
ncbi:TIGR00730 family Rossman fold protein [Terriglobus roseus]|uniref:Cytokinin riboside 5'-monophosphate phosphoribohydrolase n=1 Tax=Terriglobus roseus TaxID=392734 RepID=A0A1G7LU42_9BACT|nr:TIGR00730 family Rossman fold protein [Terriglobus roseus]SDF52963.1 hypothetical protein SAMN05444167_2628 [Terriglobus roseus]